MRQFPAEFKKKMIEIKTQFEDVFGEGDGKIQDQIDSIVQDIEAVESSISSLVATVNNISAARDPDGVTIVLNEDDELEVNLEYIMDGGYL